MYEVGLGNNISRDFKHISRKKKKCYLMLADKNDYNLLFNDIVLLASSSSWRCEVVELNIMGSFTQDENTTFIT